MAFLLFRQYIRHAATVAIRLGTVPHLIANHTVANAVFITCEINAAGSGKMPYLIPDAVKIGHKADLPRGVPTDCDAAAFSAFCFDHKRENAVVYGGVGGF